MLVNFCCSTSGQDWSNSAGFGRYVLLMSGVTWPIRVDLAELGPNLVERGPKSIETGRVRRTCLSTLAGSTELGRFGSNQFGRTRANFGHLGVGADAEGIEEDPPRASSAGDIGQVCLEPSTGVRREMPPFLDLSSTCSTQSTSRQNEAQLSRQAARQAINPSVSRSIRRSVDQPIKHSILLSLFHLSVYRFMHELMCAQILVRIATQAGPRNIFGMQGDVLTASGQLCAKSSKLAESGLALADVGPKSQSASVDGRAIVHQNWPGIC